jgi:hypothetical protein
MDETYEQNQTDFRPALRRPVRAITREQEEKKERIKIWMGAALVTVALGIDGFQAILNLLVIGEFLSPVISVGADLLFIIWFWMLGLGFIKSPKKFATMGLVALIGLIPALDTLPELTLGILVIVLMTRAEDKGGILRKVASVAQGKMGA